jgi:hypothetical protein
VNLPFRKYLSFVAIIFIANFFRTENLFSQKTVLKGSIIDASTNEILPYVNISFLNTNIGTITEDNGTFYLETTIDKDSILISYVGYESQILKIKKFKTQELEIKLVPTEMNLNEITVYAGENPAHPIFRSILKNKKMNNPEKLEHFNCEVYNKLQIDLNNVTEKFKQRKAFKKFQFVFELEDSSEVMGKTYLPVFLTENYSRYYYQKRPKRKKEITVASRISGIENKSYIEFTGQMYIDINLYDNYVNVFGQQFVSPFSNTGMLVYKYFLEDSAYLDNKWCYNITFKPRRKQEKTFYGDFWVNDTTWAIKKVNARISEDANINYVKDLIIDQEYTAFGDTIWFKTKDEMFADINLADKAVGFFGRKQTIYKNLDFTEQPDNFFSATQIEESIIADTAKVNEVQQWNDLRPEKLTEEQEEIYEMVDSVKNVPLFRTVTDLIYLLAYGYYLYKDFEFGPYFKTYSFNPIEGSRFRIGGRTSNNFSTRIMLYGHLAYGTKDEEFKYGLGALYMFKKDPRLALDVFYENDLYLLGQSVNAFSEDNILASVLSVRPNDNLLPLKRYRLSLEKEWFTGFSNEIKLFYGRVLPSNKIPFGNLATGETHPELRTAEVTLNTRFAYNEKVVRGEFERVSLGSIYPIIDLELTAGLPNVLESDFEYYRIRLNISDRIDIKPFGYLKYQLMAGKIIGKVPFPLLILHEGNETYAMDLYSYNLMNYYEFASDFYQGVYLEHHFQGLFLNKIPLFRKLKWREILYAKMLRGTISDENKAQWDFPETLGELTTPYVEAGVGIENIFKIIRIDAIWRLSNLNKPDIQTFGIRAKFQLIF